MNGSDKNRIDQLKEDIANITNVWHTVRVGMGTNIPQHMLSKLDGFLTIVDNGLGFIDKIVASMEILVKVAGSEIDIWKYALNGALDIAESFLEDKPSVRFISLPPLMLVKNKSRFNPDKPRLYRIYSNTTVYPYVSPVSGVIVPGLYAYPGQDLSPFNSIIKGSILDQGDPNAPRFEGNRQFWVLNAVVEAGSSVLDLFSLASVLRPMKFLGPSFFGNEFNISATAVDGGAIIRFDSDSIIKGIMQFSADLFGDHSGFSYNLYRSDGNSIPGVAFSGSLFDLFKNNWRIVDGYGNKKGIFLYYNAEILNKDGDLVMISNRVPIYCGVSSMLEVRSVPPDWSRVTVEELMSSKELVSEIFTLVRSAINTIGSLAKTITSSMEDILRYTRYIISFIREWISRIETALKKIIDLFKNIYKLRFHVSMSGLQNGDYTDLMAYYDGVLLKNPPQLDRSSDKIVYMISVVGDSSNIDIMNTLGSILSNTANHSKYEIEKSISNINENIDEFRRWLDSLNGQQGGSRQRI